MVTHGWVEKPSADAEKDPYVDDQREAESQGDVKKRGGTCRAVDSGIGSGIGNLGGGKGEGEEQGSADKLAQHGDDQMADSVWKPREAWQSPFARTVRIFSVGWLHAWKDHEAVGGPVGVHRGQMAKSRILIVDVRAIDGNGRDATSLSKERQAK